MSDLLCFKSEALLKRQRGVAEAMKTSFREPRRPTFPVLQSCCYLSRGSLSGRNQYLWLPPIRGARRWSEHDACLRHDQCVCDTARLPVLAFHTQFMFHLFPSSAALVYEAVQRVLHPESVDGPIMFGTAAAGFAVNILMLSVLGHGHSHGGGHSHDGGHSHGEGHGHSHGGSKGGGRNIAVYAAFIHGTCCHTASYDPHPLKCCHFAVVGDLIQSVGVMIAAVVIWVKPEWHLADPICTFLFSVLVLFSTVNILRSSMGILMNSAPQHVDVPLLLHALQHISGVSNVHDLHVWTLSSQVTAMTVHLVADKPREALSHALRIAKKHGIQHPTVQVEKCGSSDVKACAENCSSCTLKVDLTDTEVKRIMQSCADDHGEAACSSGHGHSHSHSHGHGHSHGGAPCDGDH